MRKPSTPQMTLLLAAVANGGYATAGDLFGPGVRTVTRDAVRRAGWMTSDYRIQEAGREAADNADRIAYTAALAKIPAAHLASPTRSGDPVPARMIPDGLVQYDVPAGRGADFVGYQVYLRRDDALRTIVRADVTIGSDGMKDCRLYVSDGKGGFHYVAYFAIEFACYGPEGGPRLELAAEVELAKELAAAQPELTAAEIVDGDEHDTGEITIGEDAAGQPVQITLADNHAPLAQADDEDDPYKVFKWGTTGSGKTNLVSVILAELEQRIGEVPVIDVIVEEARAVLAPATTARAQALLNTLMKGGQHDRLIVMDPKRLAMQHPTQQALAAAMTGQQDEELTGPERSGVARGIGLATFRRIYPAVQIADGNDLLRRAEIVRDALVRDLTELGMEPAVRTVIGDVRETGYRVALYALRTNAALPERVRRGACYLEIALSAIARHQPNGARNSLNKAAVALV